jgi:hypothetical protein
MWNLSGVNMPANDRRPWPSLTKHQHVLGEVKIVMIGQSKVRALMLYEQSVERDQLPAELPELRGRVIGDQDRIRCTICQRPVADWLIGEDGLEALLERVMKPVV